jgi:hypothetical protein
VDPTSPSLTRAGRPAIRPVNRSRRCCHRELGEAGHLVRATPWTDCRARRGPGLLETGIAGQKDRLVANRTNFGQILSTTPMSFDRALQRSIARIRSIAASGPLTR